MARGSGPDIKDRARSMMGRVVELRSRAARPSSVDAGENKPPRPEPREASPAGATSTPAGPTARTFVGGGGRVIPDLRRVQEGETRVLGQFDGVECRPNGILLSIKLPDRALRITAASFNAVVFIAYKQDAPRGVNCGRVEPPLRAYATYRSVAGAPSSAGDGQAVAIEILPDDYTPER
jgi:hypothetical protein